MKKLLIIFVLLLSLCLTACGQEPAAPTGGEQTPVSNETNEQEAKKDPYEITYQNIKLYSSSLDTVWSQAIVEITNTGDKPLYLSSGAYDIEGTDGSLLASQTLVSAFPQYIEPGEKGYYYEETTHDNIAANQEVVLVPRPQVEDAQNEVIRFPVSDLNMVAGAYDMGVKITGRVENTSTEEQTMVYVVATLYDADGMPIGLMFQIVMEDIAAGDKIGFEINSFSLPDDVNIDTVKDYTVVAYPLQMQF